MTKIIITGPESSGKTTLAKNLSKSLNLNLVEEYARTFINENNNLYEYEDLLKIAKGQYKREMLFKDENFCLCDTDLITIMIWSKFKFNKCDNWIINKIIEQKNEKRIYLLCKPDIKWEYDPQRESEFKRGEIYDVYLNEIKKLEYKFYIVEEKKRLENSLAFLEKEVF